MTREWTDLGIAGAALALILYLGIALLRYLDRQDTRISEQVRLSTQITANHLSHLTPAIESLAKAVTELRVHCAGVWSSVTHDTTNEEE